MEAITIQDILVGILFAPPFVMLIAGLLAVAYEAACVIRESEGGAE